jgi:hypothetical protein
MRDWGIGIRSYFAAAHKAHGRKRLLKKDSALNFV